MKRTLWLSAIGSVFIVLFSIGLIQPAQAQVSRGAHKHRRSDGTGAIRTDYPFMITKPSGSTVSLYIDTNGNISSSGTIGTFGSPMGAMFASNVYTRQNVFASGSMYASGSVNASTTVNAATDLTAGGNATITGAIRSNSVHAAIGYFDVLMATDATITNATFTNAWATNNVTIYGTYYGANASITNSITVGSQLAVAGNMSANDGTFQNLSVNDRAIAGSATINLQSYTSTTTAVFEQSSTGGILELSNNGIAQFVLNYINQGSPKFRIDSNGSAFSSGSASFTSATATYSLNSDQATFTTSMWTGLASAPVGRFGTMRTYSDSWLMGLSTINAASITAGVTVGSDMAVASQLTFGGGSSVSASGVRTFYVVNNGGGNSIESQAAGAAAYAVKGTNLGGTGSAAGVYGTCTGAACHGVYGTCNGTSCRSSVTGYTAQAGAYGGNFQVANTSGIALFVKSQSSTGLYTTFVSQGHVSNTAPVLYGISNGYGHLLELDSNTAATAAMFVVSASGSVYASGSVSAQGLTVPLNVAVVEAINYGELVEMATGTDMAITRAVASTSVAIGVMSATTTLAATGQVVISGVAIVRSSLATCNRGEEMYVSPTVDGRAVPQTPTLSIDSKYLIGIVMQTSTNGYCKIMIKR